VFHRAPPFSTDLSTLLSLSFSPARARAGLVWPLALSHRCHPPRRPQDEFNEAKQWVATKLRFDHTGSVSVFETTIRELGGLLAAFDLSGDPMFVDKVRRAGGTCSSDKFVDKLWVATAFVHDFA